MGDIPLDTKTLFAVLVVTNVGALAFSVFFLKTGIGYLGSKAWVAGQSCVLVASASIFLRLSSDSPWVVLILNLGYFVGSLFMAESIWRFRSGKRMNPAIWSLLAPYSILLIVLIDAGIKPRSVLYSVFMAISALVTAYPLLRKVEKGLKYPFYLTAFWFLCIAIGHGARLALLFGQGEVSDFNSLDSRNAIVYLAAILSTFVLLFAYVFMTIVRRERELAEKDARLRSLLKMRDSFISIIAHDVRAPLTSARRYLSRILIDTEKSLDSRRPELGTVAKGLESTITLLEELLQWARVQGSQEGYEPTGIPIREICARIATELSHEIEAKDLAFSVNEDSDFAALEVKVEREALAIMLRNLASNAIKFSRRGGSIRVSWDEHEGEARIVVEDSGVGMPRDMVERLRSPDASFTTPGTEGEKGNGLGLMITKALLERYDGHLEIESKEGAGSRFTLVIPTISSLSLDRSR
jgi:signal transduction histidine kinase